MDSYDWEEFAGSKLNKVVDHLIKDSLENLISLSRDQCLMTEIAIFRKNLQKISIRLRNSKISSLLKKVRRLINQYLELNISEVLEDDCKAFLSIKYDGNRELKLPSAFSVCFVMKELQNLADILDKICKYSSYSVSHCMLWLRLGHMIPHFVVALSTISRLNIICRALLIYVSDLYGGLIEYCRNCIDGHLLDPGEYEIIDGPLKDLQIKCVTELDGGQDILMEDIGQPLNRNELRLQSSEPKKLNKSGLDSQQIKSSPPSAASSSAPQTKSNGKQFKSNKVIKYTSYNVLKRINQKTSMKKVKNRVNHFFSKMKPNSV